MNIPDKAVEAAARAEHLSPVPGLESAVEPTWESLAEHEKRHWRDDVLHALEAAAPFIAAQALRDYADVVSDGRISFRDSEARGLRDRAKWLEAGA